MVNHLSIILTCCQSTPTIAVFTSNIFQATMLAFNQMKSSTNLPNHMQPHSQGLNSPYLIEIWLPYKVHWNTISSSNGSTALLHSLVHDIIFAVFNAHISNAAIHYLMLSNAYIHDGMSAKLKVPKYTLVDLIGYNHQGVVFVDIHQRPQFTFFVIALTCTQPELPLVSPLILWCMKHQRMFFVSPGLMSGYGKSFLLLSQRLMKAFLPSSLRLFKNKKVPHHPMNMLCPLQKWTKQYLVIPLLDVNTTKTSPTKNRCSEEISRCSQKDLQKN